MSFRRFTEEVLWKVKHSGGSIIMWELVLNHQFLVLTLKQQFRSLSPPAGLVLKWPEGNRRVEVVISGPISILPAADSSLKNLS